MEPKLTLSPGGSCAVLVVESFRWRGSNSSSGHQLHRPTIWRVHDAPTQRSPRTHTPIFMTDDTYLTAGSPILNNCCIGGYHSANGPQAYSHFTFIRVPGNFSQDVAALSHEVGEWMDDPGVTRRVQTRLLAEFLKTAIPKRASPTSAISHIRWADLPIICRTWYSSNTSALQPPLHLKGTCPSTTIRLVSPSAATVANPQQTCG